SRPCPIRCTSQTLSYNPPEAKRIPPRGEEPFAPVRNSSPLMSEDEVKTRFVREIELRGYDDKYIDRNEEREILQIAIQLGVSIDNARLALGQVCEERGYIIESAIARQIKTEVESAVGPRGKVDRREFNAILENTRRAVQGKK